MSTPARDEQAVLGLLRGRKTFVLTTHINPDGDAIGSEVALAGFLRDAGKTATIINHSPTPAVYDFLDPSGTIRHYTPARDNALLAGAEVIVVLDANRSDRVASVEEALLSSPATKICIDHHLDPRPFADHTLIDDDATSTGEIVYRLLTSIRDIPISPEVASALYTAIMTDTGSFRYPRVDAAIHRAVAHLLECGADPVALYTKVYERWSPGRIHLLGETLERLTTEAGGRIASVSITQEMLQRTGTAEEDTDNFTTYPMSLQGVAIGILFLELPDGVKISIRSRGQIPADELARQFGGNGHKNAAGARLKGVTLTDVEQRVRSAARKYV